jgi:hypothetical protein
MFVENTAAFFADFGQSATVGGVVVSAIFDAAYALGNAGPLGMASSQPMLTLATSAVPADPVGTSVVVAGTTYTVGAHEPDGTGMSRLMLEAV